MFDRQYIFLNGSAAKYWHPDLHRVAWVAVAIDARGAVTHKLSGPVPRQMPQSSPAAELSALAAVAARAQHSVCLVVDYLGIDRALGWSSGELRRSNSQYAGLIRSALSGVPASLKLSTRWQKSHMDADGPDATPEER